MQRLLHNLLHPRKPVAIALGVGLVLLLGMAAVWQVPPFLSQGNSPAGGSNGGTTPTSHPTTPNDPPAIAPQLVDANNRLAWRLLSQLRHASPASGKNLFVSPTSITTALQMTWEGAQGKTQQAIAQTLALDNLPAETRRQAMADLANFLRHPAPSIQLDLANALWVAPSEGNASSLNPEFVKTVRKIYQAEVAELNFATPEAIATINNWVAQNTSDRIPTIARDLPENTIAFLANAIYFKGLWARPFDPENTQNRDFSLANGNTISHPFLAQNATFSYYENNLFQAISLPYGEPEKPQNFRLYIFLPQPNRSLSDFYQQVTPETWENWLQEFRPLPGSIALPKLQLEYETSLVETLSQMGMEIAFDPVNANFNGMRTPPPNLFLNRVQHKTFLEIDEKGTEAAGATSVGVGTTSVAVDTFDMEVNRPFFLAICDHRSGLILFVGSIVSPR
ncbi:serpin family protein [Geitlerinema sp. PCC 9228]|uniref:serpin family protein n=1 Tax=Geitlerinema sp. PCC 9228 TaxID=111611 RepID=UPI000A009061|nr:serpin family protein [Geitlerinema sp. PCC 9228]